MQPALPAPHLLSSPPVALAGLVAPGGEAGGGAGDFDFFQGAWSVRHRRLRARLVGCAEWEEFGGSVSVWPILGGAGNIDDNVLHLPGGTYRAATLRAYDAAQRRWSIWWLDGRRPDRLDVPVTGSFAAGTGTFEAEDTLDGRPIRVRFRWLHTATPTPRWEQAFSPDAGATWETNWTMDFTRVTA